MSRAMQFKAIIKNLALKNHIPAQAVMQNFMLERLLERIATSKYKNQFVLKGGLLIASMVGINNRTTMDLDATMRDFPLSHTSIRTVLLNICSIQLDDDINLKLERIMPIREDNRYGGYRASVMARFESISTPLKLDITCGDILTPNAIRHAYHSFFENKTIEV